MLGSLPRHLVLSLHLPRPKGSVRFGRDDDEAKEERKEPRKRRDEPNRGKTRVNILSFGDGTERSEWRDERRMECLLVSFPSSSRLLPLRSGAAGGGWEHGRYEPWVRSERSGERNEPSVFPSLSLISFPHPFCHVTLRSVLYVLFPYRSWPKGAEREGKRIRDGPWWEWAEITGKPRILLAKIL